MPLRTVLSSLCLALALSACGGLLREQPPVAQPHPLTDCHALTEEGCNAAPGCVAIYGEEDAPQPVPMVATVSGCMAFPPAPFHHCEEAPTLDPCAGLDDSSCAATPGCALAVDDTGVSQGSSGAAILYRPVSRCVPAPVDPPQVDGGRACPAVACLLYCEHGEVLDENGCPTCACAD
jgi:hypothetical protein